MIAIVYPFFNGFHALFESDPRWHLNHYIAYMFLLNMIYRAPKSKEGFSDKIYFVFPYS